MFSSHCVLAYTTALCVQGSISSPVALTVNNGVIYCIAGIQNVNIIKVSCFFHSLRVDEGLKLLREVKDRKKN